MQEPKVWTTVLVLPGGNRSPLGVAGALRGGFYWGAAGGQCRREGPGKSERQRSAVQRHGFWKNQSGGHRRRQNQEVIAAGQH